MSRGTLAHGEAAGLQPSMYPTFIRARLNVFAHISVLCAPRDVCLSLHPSVPHRDTAESQPLSPSMLCYRQAAIYNNQLISQRVVPDSQQLLHWQTQTLPPHSHTQTRTHTDTSEQMEARWRRRGGERMYPSLFPSSTCVARWQWITQRDG